MTIKDKNTLRIMLVEQRKHLSALDLKDASLALSLQLEQSELIQNAQQFGLYFAFQNEINLESFAKYLWQHSKECYLPRLDENQNSLSFCQWYADTALTDNRFTIPEPTNTDCIPLEELDILLCPLVAIDKQGNRLGMGKGFYDTTLKFAEKRPTLIGVAYDFQIVHEVPRDSWDIPMDYIVTPTSFIKTSKI